MATEDSTRVPLLKGGPPKTYRSLRRRMQAKQHALPNMAQHEAWSGEIYKHVEPESIIGKLVEKVAENLDNMWWPGAYLLILRILDRRWPKPDEDDEIAEASSSFAKFGR